MLIMASMTRSKNNKIQWCMWCFRKLMHAPAGPLQLVTHSAAIHVLSWKKIQQIPHYCSSNMWRIDWPNYAFHYTIFMFLF